MAYSNSPLVSYTKLSPNHSGQRTHSIDRMESDEVQFHHRHYDFRMVSCA